MRWEDAVRVRGEPRTCPRCDTPFPRQALMVPVRKPRGKGDKGKAKGKDGKDKGKGKGKDRTSNQNPPNGQGGRGKGRGDAQPKPSNSTRASPRLGGRGTLWWSSQQQG